VREFAENSGSVQVAAFILLWNSFYKEILRGNVL